MCGMPLWPYWSNIWLKRLHGLRLPSSTFSNSVLLHKVEAQQILVRYEQWDIKLFNDPHFGEAIDNAAQPVQ